MCAGVNGFFSRLALPKGRRPLLISVFIRSSDASESLSEHVDKFPASVIQELRVQRLCL